MTNKKIVAIHQPNYIPWLGYFYKMHQCDVLVYLDNVQYPRGQSFAPRNRIKTPNGVVYLTIPVRIPEGKQGKVKYNEVIFANDKWKQKHLKTIQMSYKRAPFFDEIFEIYQSILLSNDNFVTLNINLIEAFAQYLDIKNRRVKLSEILTTFGKKTDLIIDICKAVGADTYLSGAGGGKEYTEEKLLSENNIELIYSTFEHPAYPQLWGEFISHLSIIDLLCNCGPRSKTILLENNEAT